MKAEHCPVSLFMPISIHSYRKNILADADKHPRFKALLTIPFLVNSFRQSLQYFPQKCPNANMLLLIALKQGWMLSLAVFPN